MNRFRKKINTLRNANEAAVGVVVAVLMVGLVLSVIWLVQSFYVPRWMEQKEAEHMDEVLDRFSMLKFAIDMQILTEKDIPASTSILLGSKELPFLESSRSFGFLSISSNSGINVTTTDGTSTRNALGRIKYSSENVYFLDQSYIYEVGAVITSQSEGDVMSIIPSFDVMYSDPTVKLSFDAINVLGIGEKVSVSGYGTYPIQTKFSDANVTDITDVQSIALDTSYQNAWNVFINGTLSKKGLSEGSDFWINTTDSGIKIEFASALDVDITLKIVNIFAQIGLGWIE
ncbi:MAG: hypothetical protein U9R21_06665 [Candidatus Thermoplasmatota archaeon]|nr:hypothetical protein [Candidatus Thermoplasmatota archaeon]